MDQRTASVAYDTNIEDVADAQIRYLMYTSVGKQWRRKDAAIVGASIALGVVIAIANEGGWSNTLILALAGVAGLILGSAGAWIAWVSYKPRVKRRVLRMLKGELGTGPFRCEINLTSEGVVTQQKGVGLTMPWADFLELTDTPAGVELHFRGSYVMARARAFATPADRANFIDNVTYWRKVVG